MVLSYYIATQTVEHLRFLFIIVLFLFFLPHVCFSYFLEKRNATHSSSKPRLAERDFYFEMCLMWSLQYKQLAHTINRTCVYIQRGRASQDQGVEGEEGGGEARFPIHVNGEGLSSPTGTAVLGSVDLYLGQCIRYTSRGGWVNTGSSVHSVGRTKVVSPPPDQYDGATSFCGASPHLLYSH